MSSNPKDSIDNEANCVNFTSSMNIIADSNCRMQNYLNDLAKEKCINKKICEVNILTKEILNRCSILGQNSILYLSYLCHDPNIEIGNLSIDRGIISYILVGIDTASILIILITVIILRFDYSNLNKSFKQQNKSINQYTINVKNLNIEFDHVDEEVNLLMGHFDKIINDSLKLEYLDGKNLRLKNLQIKKDDNGIEFVKINIKKKKLKEPLKDSKIINYDNFDYNVIGSDFNYGNNNLPAVKEENKFYDFTNEVNYSTYIYEVNYPYLSTNKLQLILDKERLLNHFLIKNSRLKELKREYNFGPPLTKKKEDNNKDQNNPGEQFDNLYDFNLDKLDNIDNLNDLNNENKNENNNNDPEKGNLKNISEENLPEPSTYEKYEYKRLIDSLKDLKKELIEIIKKLKNIENKNNSKVNDILITFYEPKYCKFIYSSYQKNKCTRFFYIFCCKYSEIKRFYYKKKWLQINKNPDNPSNIKWQNMIISPVNRCLSKSFSIFLSILLILIAFGIIVGGNIFQELVNKEFDNNIDCNFVEYNENTVISEYLRTDIPKRNRVQTFCFCKNKLNIDGITKANDYVFPNVKINDSSVFPCKEWIIAYIKYNAINVAITIIIPILNGFISGFLFELTSIEKNKNLTKDKSSNMIKIFISQFFNTGINLLIVNTNIPAIRNWNKDFPIFNGQYQDFESGWFKNVGSTIFFTMIISIFTPHIGFLLAPLITCSKRLIDSCSFKGVGSKKKELKSFLTLYVGPEFSIDARYAQVKNFKLIV